MPNENRPLKVFLCHAKADKPKVRELYRYLKRRGIRPWLDEEDLVAGQDWQVEIPKALATSDAIIICLTKNSVDREGYVQKEIKFALDKALEMPEGRIFLIPVRFEECEVPFSLSRYQWVDLFDEAGYARMMRALKFRASQLERTTVEVPKPSVSMEDDKHPFEENEQESIERIVRDQAEYESVEKAAREKDEREKAERNAVEKNAHEKAEREATEQAVPEEAEREVAEERAKAETLPRIPKSSTERKIVSAESLSKRDLQIIFALVALIVIIFGALISSSSLRNLFVQNSIPTSSATISAASVKTSAAGTANAQMTKNAFLVSGTPESVVTPQTNLTATAICDRASFVSDVNVPDGTLFAAGENFVKTWRLQNTGTCTWNTSYTLVYVSGEAMGGPSSQRLTGSVGPGQTVDISVNLTAPTDAGRHRGFWVLTNPSGVKLLNNFFVDVVVEPAALPTEITDSRGVDMVLVSAGNFTMGSDSGNENAKPAHIVYLDAFYIDRYETTNVSYKACVNAGICDEPDSSRSSTLTSYFDNPNYDEYPVIYVDWTMAAAYCEWRSARLPTEAEWEKAARGSDGRLYPWGDDEPSSNLLNYNRIIGDTRTVGGYESGKSPYGIYDMAGNVWEWVSDWYLDTYYQDSPDRNPPGPETGTERVARGGAWYVSDSRFVRATHRNWLDPSESFDATGFRCAKDVTP